MNKELHFAVYEHQLVLENKQVISRKFIVLRDGASLRFTNFHEYVLPKRSVKSITSNGISRFDFVVPLLNFLFFEKGIHTLDEMTVDMVSEYLNLYGLKKLPWDKGTEGRAKATVENSVRVILDFLERFIDDRKGKCLLKKSDLYRDTVVRDKYGKTIKVKRPVFDVLYSGDGKRIFRDIPNAAFDLIFNTIFTYHKDLLMLVALQAFAGLRPSEACNVRRQDSALGPGMIFHYLNHGEDGDDIVTVELDLRKELILRSDNKKVGGIKKERKAMVPPMFLKIFMSSYREYMKHIEGRKYEAEYGPLNINRDGKCMTYAAYYTSFKTIVAKEIVPELLNSNDPELVIYGHLVLENGISPHIFRHWYTVQLVLASVETVNELMSWRGDKSPESALTYLNDKGELMRKYKRVQGETFNYLSWLAEKRHG